MSERRVVITGIGCVSPLGLDAESTWAAMKEGVSGVAKITHIDPSPYACQIAGEVKGFEPDKFFNNPKDSRRADRYVQLGMAAVRMAVDSSGIVSDHLDRTRVGVMVSSGIGGLGTLENEHKKLVEKGGSKVSPFLIPMMIANIGSGIASMEFGFGGPNMAIVTACATSNNSIGEAWRIIKFGDADAMVAGGAEASILPCGLAGFGSMRALSTRNDDPAAASRPFDRNRDGFVMGEGAGVVVLEELEHAKARGANILAELVGYGCSADAYHLSAPSTDGSGPARAMSMALKHGKAAAQEVQYLNAHATSTGLGDVAEVRAIHLAFGEHAKNGLMVSSTKSMTGHMLGAAGGAELLACIMAIRDNVIAPTINVENQDPDCAIDCVPNTARETPVELALSNSFGFGGHNASLLVKRFS